MTRLAMIAALLCSCTTDPATEGPPNCPPPALDTCGPRPIMPVVTPGWTTDHYGTLVYAYNETDARALIAWTWRDAAWGACKEGT